MFVLLVLFSLSVAWILKYTHEGAGAWWHTVGRWAKQGQGVRRAGIPAKEGIAPGICNGGAVNFGNRKGFAASSLVFSAR